MMRIYMEIMSVLVWHLFYFNTQVEKKDEFLFFLSTVIALMWLQMCFLSAVKISVVMTLVQVLSQKLTYHKPSGSILKHGLGTARKEITN